MAKGKAKALSLLDDVLSRTRNRSPGFGTWFERLPVEAQAELETVRASFDHSKHQKAAFARAIMEAARERGWKTSGLQGIIQWLNGKR
jgi:hypothetical protein